jgi:hypothetical protein
MPDDVAVAVEPSESAAAVRVRVERVAMRLVSLGIQPTVGALLDRVDRYLALGYQRIKLKIKCRPPCIRPSVWTKASPARGAPNKRCAWVDLDYIEGCTEACEGIERV